MIFSHYGDNVMSLGSDTQHDAALKDITERYFSPYVYVPRVRIKCLIIIIKLPLQYDNGELYPKHVQSKIYIPELNAASGSTPI
jgi:hypothetical protein